MDLGRVGIWWSGSWKVDGSSFDGATELEELGYGALWSSGGFNPGLSSHFERLLAATTRIPVASGIVSIWVEQASEIAARVADLVRASAAHLGAVIDPDCEHLTIVDDEGTVLTDDQALLLFLRLVIETGAGSDVRVALPVSCPAAAERMC